MKPREIRREFKEVGIGIDFARDGIRTKAMMI
jgi:hypothetical protein